MPTFITDAELNAALADTLQKDRGTLDSLWDGIVTRSNVRAYGEIVRRMSARGFLPAQIAAWDDGAEFNLDLGVYYALQRGATMAPDTYSTKSLDEFDRRDELKGNRTKGIEPVGLTILGVWQDPGVWPAATAGSGAVGQVTTGQTETSELEVNAPGEGFLHRYGDEEEDWDWRR